jgi:1-acyl-sn-glycerol-3-phosphate acyltransferase
MIRVICGVRPIVKEELISGPKVFFANHTSHMDFTLIWSVLPHVERMKTRPVAGRDYWTRGKISKFVGSDVFNAVLIERKHITRSNNPVDQMRKVLETGDSLIVFPEGTRQMGTTLGRFKSGLYHLAQACGEVPFIPVYLENLNRMLPKGAFIPVPLISRITFGQPLPFNAVHGQREDFLKLAREALIELSE